MKENRQHPMNPTPAEEQAQAYEPPTVRVYNEDRILEILGPAQGYSGTVPGTPDGGGL